MAICAYCAKCEFYQTRRRRRWGPKYHVCGNPESPRYKEEVVPWEKHKDCFKIRR